MIKTHRGTEDDEEEDKEQVRTNVRPQAEQNAVGRFNECRNTLATKQQEVFICPKRRKLKVGLPLWMWYYKKEKGG